MDLLIISHEFAYYISYEMWVQREKNPSNTHLPYLLSKIHFKSYSMAFNKLITHVSVASKQWMMGGWAGKRDRKAPATRGAAKLTANGSSTQIVAIISLNLSRKGLNPTPQPSALAVMSLRVPMKFPRSSHRVGI